MMVVAFYSLSKKANSTAQPSGSALYSLDCKLKDSSGVLRPVLEIYQQANWNPSNLNYAYIASFGRYYYVSEWTWVIGRWECSLTVDSLASYKTQIGANTKYVLRAASTYNPDVVDTFYPTTTESVTRYQDTQALGFVQDYDFGSYVVGIANMAASGAGAVTYYVLSAATVKALVEFMLLPDYAGSWDNELTGMVDVLYRAIYSPFDYIKSCQWFPVVAPTRAGSVYLMFGNYQSIISGSLLDNNAGNWNYLTATLNLPSGWASLDAKYKTNPYARVYLHCEPWGVLELNPADFPDASSLRVRVFIDYMTGEALLRVTIPTQQGGDIFLTQASAKLGIDINLSSASINAGGLLSGIGSLIGGAAALASGGVSAAVGSLAMAGAVGDTMQAAVPSASASIGRQTHGARFANGYVSLYYRCASFADEHNAEFGKPLMESAVLNTLSGYIKCADGDISLPAFPEESEEVSNYLTSGFYYE